MPKRIRVKPIPQSESADVPEARPVPVKKKLSKWLKFAGATLLLAAFGMQMRQNQHSAKEAERMQAAELDARSHIKALEYENLYYSMKATGIDNPD